MRAAVFVTMIVVAAGLVVGCAHDAALIERLDRYGVTVTCDAAPLVFARTESRYSRSARDYLYLGPVETNRQGIRDYYLWVGIATTLDRGFIAPTVEIPHMLYLNVHGEPIELPLRPWSEVLRDGGLEPLYQTAVDTDTALAARVTLQQLELFAAEPLASIATATADGNTREYFRWEDRQGWGDFIAALSNRAGAQATSREVGR
jgi:hypothetical protein